MFSMKFDKNGKTYTAEQIGETVRFKIFKDSSQVDTFGEVDGLNYIQALEVLNLLVEMDCNGIKKEVAVIKDGSITDPNKAPWED